MTTNQINYWKNLETERSNLANEAEKYRSNLATEGLKARELAEKERSNLVNEGIGWKQAEAASSQAVSARRNALTNAANARTNAKNAETNIRKANIDEYNAATTRSKAAADTKLNSQRVQTESFNAGSNAAGSLLDFVFNRGNGNSGIIGTVLNELW